MKITDGFRLSDEQLVFLRKEYRDLNEKIKNGELQGMLRLVARQEAMGVLYDLHKLEVARLKELGDNAALTDFIQSKEQY